MLPILVAGFVGGIGATLGSRYASNVLIPKIKKLFEEIKLSIDKGKCETSGDSKTEEKTVKKTKNK